MRILNLITVLLIFILLSCGSNNEGKIKELEAKINQQQEQLNRAEKERLQSELDQKNKELEALKNKSSDNNVPRSNYFARGNGFFPEASERQLSHNELVGMSLQDLKIMRNEIFARHGYIFKTQEMINHFSRQNWYQPLYNDVYSMLSEIEKYNINLITKYE
jgi:hypothetical protein